MNERLVSTGRSSRPQRASGRFVAPNHAPAFIDTLLAQVMPLAGLAIWEAWSDPLELIRLNVGCGSPSVFPFDPEQLRPGTRWIDWVYPRDQAKLLALLRAPVPASGARSVDYRLVVGEGELLWVRHWLVCRSPRQGGRNRLRGLLMAIQEQKFLQQEWIRASEHERSRIGQELHDDLCQILAGITFLMRVIGNRVAGLNADLAGDIDELNRELIGATERVRSMAHGLFPPRLNRGTLHRALRDLIREKEVRYPVQIALKLPRSLAMHYPDQITHVYRIVQESVTNAVRHGKAAVVRITVKSAQRGVQVRIADNGAGFPETSARPEGIGTLIMQYRARMLDGTISFRNHAPHGAVVELCYPIRAAPCIPPRPT